MAELEDASPDSDTAFEPQDAIAKSTRSVAITGGAGLLLAAVQNTVARENLGAMGVFTRFGGTVAMFAAVGGTYQFISTASANLREKRDPYNEALGGFFAGAILGLRRRTMPSVVGNGMALAAIMAAINYTGHSLFQEASDLDADMYPTKEELRKRFRRPVNEVINELGEGRGIYGAGYEERRKQRLKENYGFEVQDPYWKSKS